MNTQVKDGQISNETTEINEESHGGVSMTLSGGVFVNAPAMVGSGSTQGGFLNQNTMYDSITAFEGTLKRIKDASLDGLDRIGSQDLKNMFHQAGLSATPAGNSSSKMGRALVSARMNINKCSMS